VLGSVDFACLKVRNG